METFQTIELVNREHICTYILTNNKLMNDIASIDSIILYIKTLNMIRIYNITIIETHNRLQTIL